MFVKWKCQFLNFLMLSLSVEESKIQEFVSNRSVSHCVKFFIYVGFFLLFLFHYI